MNNWKKTTLGEISINNRGYYGIGASAIDYDINKFTYLRITDINDDGTLNKNGLKSVDEPNAADYLLKPNDIVFARTGNSTGRNYFYDGRDGSLVYAGFLIKFSIDPNKINPKYVKYFLMSDEYKGWVSSFNTGSTRGNINAQTYASLEIPLLPTDQQNLIADVLSALDDKIEINNKINENLEAQAQAIFKQWFVDFEFPDEEGKPYKSNGGKFIDSELGKIPEGWKVGTLTQIASFLNGLAMQKFRPKEDEKGFPVLKIKELRQGCCDFSSDLCSERIDNNYIINNGDIIFSWSGTLMIDFWTGGICGLNQHLFKVESENYEDWFIFSWTKHHLDDFIRIAKDKAVTMGHIKREHLDKAKILIPTNEIYSDVTKILKPIFGSIINLRIENNNLSEIRDGLLPKLMSGEVRV